MRIKNIPQLNEDGFPELGRIGLGVMVKSRNSGKDHPTEADHFVLTRALDLVPKYGKEPKKLYGFLPYPEQDRNMRSAYELFKRGGLYCQGDGEKINWLIDPGKSGQVVIRNGRVVTPYTEQDKSTREIGDAVVCPGAENPEGWDRCSDCRLRTLLFLIIRDPEKPWMFINNRWGYYRISTGSMRNLIDLTTSLNTLSRLTGNRLQGLAGIPVILTREPGVVSITNDEGKRAQVEKFFLKIEIDPVWAEYGALAMAAQALGKPVEQMLNLPDVAPDDEDSDGVPDVIDSDTVPPVAEAVVIKEEIDQAVADINALRDELPGDWGNFHLTLQGVIGTSYDSKAMLLEIKQRLGLGRTDPMDLTNDVWNAACDILILRLGR